MTDVKIPPEVVEQLTTFFRRNGYVRLQNPKRHARDPRAYHKGYELRLAARTEAELRTIRRLLKAAGFAAARPFRKGNQWRQPIYGTDSVARFLALVGEDEPLRRVR